MKQCKIIVKDEVNVKIEGLELSERKALMKMFEYEIPGARYLPAVRLGRWNGKVSYFSLAGSTYINLLPEILPYLDNAAVINVLPAPVAISCNDCGFSKKLLTISI